MKKLFLIILALFLIGCNKKEEIPFKTQENNNKKGFSKFKFYLLLSAIALIVAEIIVLFEVFIGF